MTIGFDTDSDDQTTQVGDGKHEHAESLESEARVFLQLCKDLREMGATYVRAGSLRAEFAPNAATTQPKAVPVIRVPIGPQEPKRAPDEHLELYPGEKLSDEDKARRREQQRIRDIVTGS